MVSIDDFNEVKDCIYKDEHYSVRDNGAILRHSRNGMRKRRLDNVWTFGIPSIATGYMIYGNVRVHRIVATAFHGPAPSDNHVVDHIDTNRHNNRPDNLRWVTRFENALNNEITRTKIVLICGSIENFINNPQLLWGHELEDKNFSWMKNVTPEEAKNSYDNWIYWARTARSKPNYKKEEHHVGDWVYEKPLYSDYMPSASDFHSPSAIIQVAEPAKEPIINIPIEEEIMTKDVHNDEQDEIEKDEYDGLTDSLTANAKQLYWRTPSEFPCCPNNPTINPLEAYRSNLKTNAIFCKNKIYSSLVVDSALLDDGRALLVMTKSGGETIKPWALAKVVFKDGIYIHISMGSFFAENGARKQFTLAQGKEWDGEDSIDDFC